MNALYYAICAASIILGLCNIVLFIITRQKSKELDREFMNTYNATIALMNKKKERTKE